MPNDGVELSPPNNILSDDEIVRLAQLFVQSGVRKIRLTGGEPTVRKGLANLVGMCQNKCAMEVGNSKLIQDVSMSLEFMDCSPLV